MTRLRLQEKEAGICKLIDGRTIDLMFSDKVENCGNSGKKKSSSHWLKWEVKKDEQTGSEAPTNKAGINKRWWRNLKQINQKDVLLADNLRITEDMKTDERYAEVKPNGTRMEADKKENMSKTVR